MESKRSCCSSSMCCGAPVEKGCLVFAIINAVLCVAASAGSLIFLIYILYTWFSESRGPSDMFLVYLFTGIAVGCCVASALALTFAVVLVMGLRSGNKGYVMAYLGYGVVVVVLSVLGCLGFIALEWGETQPMLYTLIPLGVSFLYSLLLLLVYQTYTVFSKSTPATHARLLNTYDL